MDKRWTLVIITILMVLMIYTFLSLVLKKDKKKTVSTRIYRDYSNYSSKSDSDSDYYYDSKTYSSSTEARKIKRNLFSNAIAVSASSYNDYMQAAIKKPESDISKPINNSKYQRMKELSKIELPEYQVAVAEFRDGNYESSLINLTTALEKLNPLEMENRINIHSLMAECYLKLKDKDGYIQNKIRYVRMMRKYNKALKEAFPDYPDYEFMSTQEASTSLLRIKSSVSQLPDSPMVREMVRKAEYDLEVARKVTQD